MDEPLISRIPTQKLRTTMQYRRNFLYMFNLACISLSASPLQAADIPDPVLQHLGKTGSMLMRTATHADADDFLRELETFDARDKRFLFYRAVALECAKDHAGALAALVTFLASGYVPTFFESQTLARQISSQLGAGLPPPITQPAQDAVLTALNEEIAAHPYGQAEATRLHLYFSKGEGDPACLFVPEPNIGAASKAAKLYAGMHRNNASRSLYNRAAGFLKSDQLFADIGADIWTAVADTYADDGDWENAEGYYLKAIAATGPRDSLINSVRQMETNLREGKKPAHVPPAVDRKALEQIVTLCVSTELFPDALDAVAEMEKADITPDPRIVLSIHQGTVQMIERMMAAGFKGVQFRGVWATDANLEKERQTITAIKRSLESDHR